MVGSGVRRTVEYLLHGLLFFLIIVVVRVHVDEVRVRFIVFFFVLVVELAMVFVVIPT